MTLPQVGRSSTLTVRTAIIVGLAVLSASVGFALRWPNAWWGSGPGDRTDFDYSALDARFGSLRDGYVRSLLGGGSRSGLSPGAHGSGAPGATARTSAPVPVRHAFSNDDFERAYNVNRLPFSGRTDATDATRQSSDPADCAPAGGTAWYRYTAPGNVALFADTFGTPESITLGVFAGSSPASLRLVGCDTNVLGNAQVGFRAAKGRTYYFQLTPTVKGGPTVFELAAVGPTTIESHPRSGGPAADTSAVDRPDISGDGRYVAFVAVADDAACDERDSCESLYLRDRVTGKALRIADAAGGIYFSLSADGRYLGFSAYSFLPAEGLDAYSGTADAQYVSYNTYLYDRITRRIELVSRNSAGEPARTDYPPVYTLGFTRGSQFPSVSADGRYVVFGSDADNLGTTNEPGDWHKIYRRDRVTGTTRLVSTDESGRPMRGMNCAQSGRNVSGDGRYVVFMNAPVSDAVSEGFLVYLWDARTGRSRLVTRLPSGTRPRGSYCPSISQDGSRVGLVSRDPLVPEDTNDTPDVYVYEVATGRLKRISVTSAGKQTHDPNYIGREHGHLRRSVNLSADGRFAAFDSAAPDLAPSAIGSTRHPPETTRVFVHDILTGATVLASVSSTGEPLPGDSHMPYISPDGRSVAFMNLGVTGRREVMVHELR